MSLKPFPTDRCEWHLFHGTVNVTHLQYDIAKWWIWWANADVSRKTFRQSSSSDVSIQGSSLGHRQITLQSMVVLSRRLTMGSYSSCVGMQMSTRTYTNAQSVSHLGGWGGGCKMESQGSQGVKITSTHFQQFNSSVFVSYCHNLKSGWILSWAEAIPRRRCGTTLDSQVSLIVLSSLECHPSVHKKILLPPDTFNNGLFDCSLTKSLFNG